MNDSASRPAGKEVRERRVAGGLALQRSAMGVDRPHVRSSLIASLVTVFTLSLLLAWHPKAPGATKAKPAAANAVATAPEAGPDNTNENLGCGCAESCYATK